MVLFLSIPFSVFVVRLVTLSNLLCLIIIIVNVHLIHVTVLLKHA